jgi:RNA polymerase sigma factor (sigma-70 family)
MVYSSVMGDDDELLAAWRAGDRRAGDALVGRWFEPICRFFRSKLGDDIEDLIQRTFLDCLESRDRLRQPSFRSFLFAVARNRLFDELRRELRRPVDQLGSISMADVATRPSERVARAETRDVVLRAMRTLPVDFQIALELAYWEDLTGVEIASILGISEHTVRSRLSRARRMLRAQVQELAAVPELDHTLAALSTRWSQRANNA